MLLGPIRPHMADQPVPDWDTYPDLDGVITTADTTTKGSGNFSATFVNHMKVAQLMRKHAKGWQFELRTTTDEHSRETHVFRAPDGTGYVVGFFRAPTGSGFLDTPDMVHAVMNNRMQAVKWEQITARDLTDTERRAMCVIAARHFGLAYELWAKDPIEDPYRADDEPATPPAKKTPKPKSDTPAQQQSAAKPKADPLADRKAACKEQLGAAYKAGDKGIVDLWQQALKLRFNGAITADKPTVANLTTEEQIAWCEEWIVQYKAQTKA